LVISSPEEGPIAIWNNHKASFINNPKDEPLRSGDKFTYNGKEYTVDRGITDEIEKHAAHIDGTPVRYHKNAFLSAFDYHRQMTSMKEYRLDGSLQEPGQPVQGIHDRHPHSGR
jgi:hypothetical protein